MNKICLFASAFCALIAVIQARECYYIINHALCPYECCGEEGSMQCIDSCNGVACDSNEDCGSTGCCSNGKCTDSNSDCDSEKYIPCSDDCPAECCDTLYGTCNTGRGCFHLNWNCSSSEDCASYCCYKGYCQSSEVCALNPNDDDGVVMHEDHSDSSTSSSTHVNWKTPVVVVAIIIAVVVKITLLVLWAVRRSRSRVVVVQRVVVPNSTIQVNHGHTSDSVPLVAQDEEQIKHEQPPPQYTA